ncbi:universal stress protein [Mycolicibacterium brisbanense]|uniref:UspA domain-containing protein n=2 Tax=Mycolicibacterium brisbanense TaxID=146020 RepID=A0A100VYR2_9MYCO|nr:universal stress protein [Mycolicibacterium brisbanense]MCV7160144.1 universal stress protein [Mycolicibacterium brisbanense]GAS88424.1 UspA domain-containing protein [Mycolicibacterium brisbanense]
MTSTPRSSPGIVVGIDGSRCALNAALWATDEAVSRNVPLRLIYVVEPRNGDGFDGQEASRDLARADIAIRQARIALESTEKPVKIEWAVLHGEPAAVLLTASESADMLCVGSFGLTHAVGDQRPGSTAMALPAAAACPVAVIGSDCGPYITASQPGGASAADGDDHPGDPIQLLIVGQQGNETRGATRPMFVCP